MRRGQTQKTIAGKIAESRSKAADFKVQVRQHEMSFVEADLNDDGFIDELEFNLAIPEHVRRKHGDEAISSWFKLLDTNGSGAISRDEHLRWSLNAAALTSGASIQEVFEKYDRDASGTLSELEFCRAARDVGVGSHAEQLFRSLPGSADGSVSYGDLIAFSGGKFVNPTGDFMRDSKQARAFLMAMAWSADSAASTTDVDTRSWSFTAKTVEEFRTALVEMLERNQIR